jgi:hypothetical protein
MPKFKDIPQFTTFGLYTINVSWNYLEEQLKEWLHPTFGASLDLDPYFQREHVWTLSQQISYVEYVLKGGRSGRELLFNFTGWNSDFRGPFVLVDGKQRLNAVRQFLGNCIPIFGGNLFSAYTDKVRSVCTDFIFRVNDLETRSQVLTWYLETNAGGTPHTQEELDKVHKLLIKENLQKS